MDKSFLCKICDLNFMNEAMLMTHATTVHTSRPLENVIDIPKAVDNDNSHGEVADEFGPNRGDICDVRQNDNEGKADIYLCSACGDIFVNEVDMEEHCRVVHAASNQQRVYECEQCRKRYDTEEAFDVHDCDEASPTAWRLASPSDDDTVGTVDESCTLIKMSEKANVCHLCSIVFVSKYALDRHNLIVHNKSSSVRGKNDVSDCMFQCSKCPARFTTMKGMKNHAVDAHEMKWNNVRQRTRRSCCMCQKMFSSTGNLNKHMKAVHKVDNSPPDTEKGMSNVNIEIHIESDKSSHQEVEAQPEPESVVKTRSKSDMLKLSSKNDTTVVKNEAHVEVTVPIVEAVSTSPSKPSNSSVWTVDSAPASETTDCPVTMDTDYTTTSDTVCFAAESSIDNTVALEPPASVGESADSTVEMRTVFIDEGETISLKEEATIVVEDGSEETGYVLELDDNVYRALGDAGLHMVIENQDSNWYCSTCDKNFLSRESLLVHYRNLHLPDECEPETNSPQQCDICLKIFSTKGNRDKHVNMVHKRSMKAAASSSPDSSDRFSCEHCEKKFRLKGNLAKHIRKAHPKLKNPSNKVELNKDATDADRTCHICGKQFPDLMKKEVHVYNHTRSNKDYRCEVCGQTFTRKDYYKEHYEKKHGVPRYKCSYCEKRFVRRTYMEIHERIHTNYRPYVCKICGKAFKQWGGLHQHQRFHAAKPPATHFCSHCHRGYSYKADLDRHMVVHSERRHVCEFCSKPFPSASQLTVHVRTHTGQRPYKCGICSMCFMTMGGLRRHEQIHERREEGGFMCGICHASYRRQASVDEHIRVFHSDHLDEESVQIQAVDLIQDGVVSVNDEIVQFVVHNNGTVQVDDAGVRYAGIEVLNGYVTACVDTSEGEKALVEGILASQDENGDARA